MDANLLVKLHIYRKAHLPERVNRTLVQSIFSYTSYVGQYHRDWERFLNQFTYALRTNTHALTSKTPAKVFLERKLIIRFESMTFNTEQLSERIKNDID